jgi:SH3-like domain-containing protein
VRTGQGATYPLRADHANTASKLADVGGSLTLTAQAFYVITDVDNEWVKATYNSVTGWVWIAEDFYIGWDDTEMACAVNTPTEYASNPPPTPAPTQPGPTPTAIPPIPVGCTVKNGTSGNLNTRSGPGLNYAVIGTLRPGDTGQAIQTYSNGEEVWINFSRLSDGGSNVFSWVARFIPAQGALASLVGPCDGLPEMVAHGTAGIHVLGGFQKTWDILADIDHFSLLKITDDSLFLATEAKKINPSLVVIQRNIHLVGLGLRNCPDSWATGDPIAVARNWWAVQMETWGARGLLGANSPIDFFEERNECIWAEQWEVAYQKEIIRLANQSHVCLALFSYFYGYPEPEQFAQLTPILDAVLATECQPGKHHVLAVHTYGNVSSGKYIWGRWDMLRQTVIAIDPRYAGLRWAMTEFGLTSAQGTNDGRGSPDCGRAALETRQAVDEYKKHPEVLGFGIYSFGGNTEWIDFTECLPMIAAALQ